MDVSFLCTTTPSTSYEWTSVVEPLSIGSPPFSPCGLKGDTHLDAPKGHRPWHHVAVLAFPGLTLGSIAILHQGVPSTLWKTDLKLWKIAWLKKKKSIRSNARANFLVKPINITLARGQAKEGTARHVTSFLSSATTEQLVQARDEVRDGKASARGGDIGAQGR
jgi:hypothetical protein